MDRNLTEWKKPYLMPPGEEEEEEAPASKPKLSKHTTMKGTAKVMEKGKYRMKGAKKLNIQLNIPISC